MNQDSFYPTFQAMTPWVQSHVLSEPHLQIPYLLFQLWGRHWQLRRTTDFVREERFQFRNLSVPLLAEQYDILRTSFSTWKLETLNTRGTKIYSRVYSKSHVFAWNEALVLHSNMKGLGSLFTSSSNKIKLRRGRSQDNLSLAMSLLQASTTKR